MNPETEKQLNEALEALKLPTCKIALRDMETLQDFLTRAKQAANAGDMETVCILLAQIAWRADAWAKDWS